MKKIILIVVGIIIILAVVGISKNYNRPTSGETIKIGGNFALTGYGASWAENQLNGAQLAIKEINGAGGVLGKKLELVPEDNRTESKGAVSATNKLISFDKVSFLLTGWGEQTEPIIPIIDQNKIITLTVAAGIPGITKSSKYLFRTWPSDGMAVESLVNYARQQGYKKIGFIHTTASWENSLTEFFSTDAAKRGIDLGDPISVTIDTQDFKTHIVKLKEQKLDAVFIPMGPGPLERFVKQSRDLGLNVPFLYPVDVITLGLPEKVASAYLKGIIYARYASPKQDFINSFEKEYGKEPGVSADTAYDAIYMIANAIKKAGSIDPEKVMVSFEPLEGASGRIVFDQDGDRSDAEVILMGFDGLTNKPMEIK